MSDAPLTNRALTLFETWRGPEWQRLWLSIRARPWRSLAIIPAGVGAASDLTVRIAVMLSRTGMLHLGAPIQVADGTRVPLSHLSSFMEEVRRCAEGGDLILVALAPLAHNPVSLALAKFTDAAVLCVASEQMMFSEAKKTIAEIGLSRFIGSAIFHGAPKADPKPPTA